ncbi:hypothetical protein C9374_006411 [Naegleria lovaniensis]|uniref:Kelch repeat-containing protein n=1 Tax=Naegleria lovaniensis TaxID=51637 RepID=A0AA88KHR8_NAELO|nr:uncharacterized protein C9374_006411 [Naegleria lovaniensis]KAG2381422.1 hypothetical protein C9374_006411 [Naegleria lovaniensis]
MKAHQSRSAFISCNSQQLTHTRRAGHFITASLVIASLLTLATLTSLVFSLSLGKWEEVHIRKGALPLERPFHGCDLHPSGKKMIVYGGRTGITTMGNTFHSFSFQEKSWNKYNVEPVDMKAIPSLAGHSFTTVGDKIYIYGGRSGLFHFSDELFVVDTQSDTIRKVTTEGDAPSALQSHSASALGECIIIYGGSDGKRTKNDLYAFNTKTNAWKLLRTTNPGPFIEGHKSILVGNRLFMIGGVNSNNDQQFNSDINVLALPQTCDELFDGSAALTWSVLRVGGKPRAFHSASLLDDKIYVHGGMNSLDTLQDTKVFDIKREKWLDDSTIENEPSIPRRGHCSVVFENSVYIFGGSSDWKRTYNDVWLLNTKPEITFEPVTIDPKKGLSEYIEDALASVQQLSSIEIATEENEKLNADILKSENELRQLITADTDDSSLTDLVKRIAQWKKIETLFLELQQSKSKVQNMTENIKFDFEDIDNLVKEYNNQVEVLKKSSEALTSRLSTLKEKEDKVASEEKKAKDLLLQQESVLNTVHSLEGDLDQQKVLFNNKNRLREKVVKERESLHERLNQLNTILNTADDIQKESQAKESTRLADLERVREQIGTISSEIEDYRKIVKTLNHEIRSIDNRLSKINELTTEAQDVKLKFAEQLKYKYAYEKSKDDFLSKVFELEEENISEKIPKKTEEEKKNDEMKELDTMIETYRIKYQKTKSAKSIEFQQASDELKRREAKLKELKEQEEKITAELSSLRERIASKKNEKESSQLEKDKIEDAWKEKCSEADTLEVETNQLKNSIDEVQSKLNDERKESQKVASALEAQRSTYQAAKSDLDNLNTELKDSYEKVVAYNNGIKKLGSKISAMKRAVSVRKSDYDDQRADFVKFRDALNKAIEDADRVFLDRIRHLEAQLSAFTGKSNVQTSDSANQTKAPEIVQTTTTTTTVAEDTF